MLNNVHDLLKNKSRKGTNRAHCKTWLEEQKTSAYEESSHLWFMEYLLIVSWKSEFYLNFFALKHRTSNQK